MQMSIKPPTALRGTKRSKGEYFHDALHILLVTPKVGDLNYGVSKSKTKPFFKMVLAVSSASHDQGDKVTRLTGTKKATS